MAQTILVNPRSGPMPAAMKGGKSMDLLKEKKAPSKNSKARKNPTGFLNAENAKEGFAAAAMGAAHARVSRQAGPAKFEWFHKLSAGKKAAAFYAFGMWLRSKGHLIKAGAAFAIAGQWVEQWDTERKAKAQIAAFAPQTKVPAEVPAKEMAEAVGMVVPGSGYAGFDGGPVGQVGATYDPADLFSYDTGYQVAA